MINFIILLVVLLTQLALNIYNYIKINNKSEKDGDSISGSNYADTSKKITLGNLVLAGTFSAFITILYLFKIINYDRSEFLLLVSVVIVAILMFIQFYYLDKQLKSGSTYNEKKTDFKAAQERINKTPLDISLFGGIATIGVAAIFIGLLFGKYFYAVEKILSFRQPFYVNNQVAMPLPETNKPDFMVQENKRNFANEEASNFIV